MTIVVMQIQGPFEGGFASGSRVLVIFVVRQESGLNTEIHSVIGFLFNWAPIDILFIQRSVRASRIKATASFAFNEDAFPYRTVLEIWVSMSQKLKPRSMDTHHYNIIRLSMREKDKPW